MPLYKDQFKPSFIVFFSNRALLFTTTVPALNLQYVVGPTLHKTHALAGAAGGQQEG